LTEFVQQRLVIGVGQYAGARRATTRALPQSLNPLAGDGDAS